MRGKEMSKNLTLKRKAERTLKREGFPLSNPWIDRILTWNTREDFPLVCQEISHNSSLFWAEFYQ